MYVAEIVDMASENGYGSFCFLFHAASKNSLSGYHTLHYVTPVSFLF